MVDTGDMITATIEQLLSSGADIFTIVIGFLLWKQDKRIAKLEWMAEVTASKLVNQK